MESWRSLTEGTFAVAMTAFGDLVEFRPKPTGAVIQRRVIVENQHLVVDVGGEAPISSSEPVLSIQLSDFPQKPKQGDEGTILEGHFAGKDFRIIERQEDGHGGAKLPLQWI